MTAPSPLSSEDREGFAIAAKAFGLMTMDEQIAVVLRLGSLHYPSACDRLIDAVHHVITRKERPEDPHA